MQAIWNNKIIAESEETIVIEGNQYFPVQSVASEYLQMSTYTTTCPWKGTAHYYTLDVDGKTNSNAAWYYPEPKEGAVERVGKNFSNYIAFWNGVVVQ